MSVSARVECADALDLLRSLEDSSVDAIVTDPPYFKVKGEPWDRQWDKPEEFLAWLGGIADEWSRVLKPNGSLYCYASPKMSARVELLIAERFNVLNCIRWYKPVGYHKRASSGGLRSLFPAWEAIIFAEHYGADNAAKGEAGYVRKCDELRGFIFEPLRAYLDGERRAAGVDFNGVRAAVGCAAGSGLPCHWFTRSQWVLPTEANYNKLRKAFNARGGEYLRRDYEDIRREYEDLRREYEDLRREYEDLRRDYEDLRRPFTAPLDVECLDLWRDMPVNAYAGKHCCEKPAVQIERIINASTRPGAVVLDCFAGSGAIPATALRLGRSVIACDMSEHWAAETRRRCDEVMSQNELPGVAA